MDNKGKPVIGKSNKVLGEFTSYCLAHPELRFWQALRNWSEYNFIYGASVNKDDCGDMRDIDSFFEDTYYKEGK